MDATQGAIATCNRLILEGSRRARAGPSKGGRSARVGPKIRCRSHWRITNLTYTSPMRPHTKR